MKSLRLILMAVLLTFVVSSVWGEKADKPRFHSSTYKMTAKIHLKNEYRMYDSAAAILEEGVQFFPEDAEMHFLLGKTYYYKQNYRGMAEQFAMADSLKREKDKWLEELSLMRDEKYPKIYNQGIDAYQGGDYETALDLFFTCSVLDPSDARGFWLFGDTYRLKGEFEKALSALDVALKLAPDDPGIWKSYGEVLFHTGRNKEALDAYDKVLQKKPDDSDVLFNVATIHYNAGDLDRAITAFQRLVELDSAYTNAYFNMGNAYLLQIGSIDKALDSLKTESGEPAADAKSTARTEELNQKRTELLAGATAAFEKVTQLDTTDIEAHALLAEIYQQQDSLDKALSILEALVQKDSTNCRAWQQLAFIYAKRNMGDEAKDAYQKAQDCAKTKP